MESGNKNELVFEPLYYADKLTIVNPRGRVGIVTLWSKVDQAMIQMRDAGIDLSPETSQIAVVANFYGDGLPQLLRNLLWNPQIQYLFVMGKCAGSSNSRKELLNFFEKGIEECEFLGAKGFRIVGTNRPIDGLVTHGMFRDQLGFVEASGEIGDSHTMDCLANFLEVVKFSPVKHLDRIEPPPIPEPEVIRFPSNPRDHNIVRDSVMEAWTELVWHLYRFGHRNTIQKSHGPETRIELQNVKVVIENPAKESDELLRKYGFSLGKFHRYQEEILNPVKPLDLGYTYGNRARRYFRHFKEPVDSWQICADRLKETPDSRHCYVTLWDNSRDLPEGSDTPCFVTGFFRKFDGKLMFTATFRAHNAMSAWPENLYGLMAIQRFVSEQCGIPPGAITVISHSISIDPSSLEKAKKIAEDKKSAQVVDLLIGKETLRMDPNGDVVFSVDKDAGEIVAQHKFQGQLLKEYRGKTAEELERQLARDQVASLPDHWLYIGRQLVLKEVELKKLSKK